MKLHAKIKSAPKISVLIVLGLLLLSVAIFNIKPKDVSVAQSTDCYGAYASMYGSDTTSGVIKGIANISVGLSTSTQTPTKVIILLDGQEIGQAKPESGSNYSWYMQIPTKLLDARQYELKALIKFSNYQCVTPAYITQMVEPGGISEITLTTSKTNLELPINTSVLVSASVTVPGYTTNYAQFALFDWFAESRGSVAPTQNRQTTFYSGPDTGNGKIKVIARYGFRAADTQIFTFVYAADKTNTTESTPKGSSSADSLNDDTSSPDIVDDDVVASKDSSTNTTTIEQTASLQSDDITKDCAVAALGKDRFRQINDGESRPNPQELIKLKACFARTSYIIPSNFAPVAPGEVTKLQKTNEAKLEQPQNSFIEFDGQQKQVIKLSGKAKPNSVVIVYIFSEPMVLTTTANENGEWVYELENPLEPGDHTMYAVVDRGDGVYERTDPLEFAIGSAEATADNPAGLSLVLNEQATAADSSMATYLYVASSGVLFAAIALVAVVAYRHGKHSKTQLANETPPQNLPVNNFNQEPVVNPNPSAIVKPQSIDNTQDSNQDQKPNQQNQDEKQV